MNYGHVSSWVIFIAHILLYLLIGNINPTVTDAKRLSIHFTETKISILLLFWWKLLIAASV